LTNNSLLALQIRKNLVSTMRFFFEPPKSDRLLGRVQTRLIQHLMDKQGGLIRLT
jgi:hypothetical protein